MVTATTRIFTVQLISRHINTSLTYCIIKESCQPQWYSHPAHINTDSRLLGLDKRQLLSCCYVCKSSRSVMHYREFDINRQHNLYLSNHQCIFFNIFFVLCYFMNRSWKAVGNILWPPSMKHHGLSQKHVTRITTIFLEAWTSSIALDD